MGALVNADQHLRILECSGDDNTSFRERERVAHQGQCHRYHQLHQRSLMQEVASFKATGNLQ